MWDLDGKDAAHLTGYEPFVQQPRHPHRRRSASRCCCSTATRTSTARTTRCSRASPCTGTTDVCSYDDWNSHPSYDVPNFHRIVVHGSTVPLEYLRLTANARNQPTTATSFGPFTWQRVTE